LKAGTCRLNGQETVKFFAEDRIPLYAGSVEDKCHCSMSVTSCAIAHSLASYCRRSGLIPGWSMWDLWWTKWQWRSVSSEHFSSL